MKLQDFVTGRAVFRGTGLIVKTTAKSTGTTLL